MDKLFFLPITPNNVSTIITKFILIVNNLTG
jgi:hypothetical protein